MSEKITLYTAFHRTAPMVEADFIRPIHVGRARAAKPLDGMIGDDTGDNISARNAAYCELTALYWAWKNDADSTHLGLMHYRRFLDVAGTIDDPKAEVFIDRFDSRDWAEETGSWLARHADDFDVILPKIHEMGRTVRANYCAGHAPGDFDEMRAVLEEHHPSYLDAFDEVASDRLIYLGNIFLMRRDLFMRYCEWLFDVLEKIEAAPLDRSRYSPTQSRYIGFLSERLLGVYLGKLRQENPGLRVREVNIVNTSEALFMPYVADDRFNGPEHVNIAFSADRAYLAHTAAMLRSVLGRADPARQINLFFLHSGIPAARLALLAEVVATHPKAHLHLMNAGETFKESYRSASRAPSNATYNRFLLFELLPGLDRLLYLDVDMIALGDVCELFDSDLQGASLGAVPDYIMTRTLTGEVPTVDPDVPDLGTYQREKLGLSDAEIARYFNAGLLLFDFSSFDVPQTGRALFAAANEGRYLFRDQDILNMHYKDRLHLLPDVWNVFNTVEAGYSRVPAEGYAKAMAAKRAPKIVHYAAGDYKPWKARSVPMAQHYWAALIETPFYSEVVAGLRGNAGGPNRNAWWRPRFQNREQRPLLVRAGQTLGERFPVLRPALLRGYAALRDLRG